MSEQHQCCYAGVAKSNPCYYCRNICKKPAASEKSDVDSVSGLSMTAEGGGSDIELPDFSWCDEVLGTNQETMTAVNAIIDGLDSEAGDSSSTVAVGGASGIKVSIERVPARSDSSSVGDSYQLEIEDRLSRPRQERLRVRSCFFPDEYLLRPCDEIFEKTRYLKDIFFCMSIAGRGAFGVPDSCP